MAFVCSARGTNITPPAARSGKPYYLPPVLPVPSISIKHEPQKGCLYAASNLKCATIGEKHSALDALAPDFRSAGPTTPAALATQAPTHAIGTPPRPAPEPPHPVVRFSYVLYTQQTKDYPDSKGGDNHSSSRMTRETRLDKYGKGLLLNAARIPALFKDMGRVEILIHVWKEDLKHQGTAALASSLAGYPHVTIVPFTLQDVGRYTQVDHAMPLGQQLRLARYLPMFSATYLGRRWAPVVVRDADSLETAVDVMYIKSWLHHGVQWLLYHCDSWDKTNSAIGGGVAVRNAVELRDAKTMAQHVAHHRFAQDNDLIMSVTPSAMYDHSHKSVLKRRGNRGSRMTRGGNAGSGADFIILSVSHQKSGEWNVYNPHTERDDDEVLWEYSLTAPAPCRLGFGCM